MSINKNNPVIPIAFASSDFFVPYLAVTIQSIMDCASNNYHYEFVIFNKDITDNNKELLANMLKNYDENNFSIRFVDVSKIFSNLQLYTPGHVSIETYFRLIIPQMMSAYPKILFLDCDLLIKEDVANLFNIDIGSNSIGATEECLMSALVGIYGKKVKKYMKERLGLKNIDKYFQAGVMILNISKFVKNHYSEELLKMVTNFDYDIVDQDAMNELFNGDVYWLENEWNYPPLQKHMKKADYIKNMSEYIRTKYLAVKNPKIIHFADREKPWFYPDELYASEWWSVARKTPYYELIIKNMINHSINEQLNQNNLLTNLKFRAVNKYSFNCINYWKCKLLRNLTFGKTREHYIEKKYRLKNLIRLAEECK